MHRETCTVLMGCSKGSAVRLAPSSLLCAQTGRACPGLCAWAPDCARGPVDDGARVPGTVRAGQCLGAWALLLVVVTPSCAAGPFWWQCGRPAWATTCGVNLRSEGTRVSTCPADPAVPVADAAIPVGDGTTPRRSHPSSLHLSAASGAYPSNTTRFITQSRAPTDPLRRPPPDGRRPMVAARCSLPDARCPSLRVRRCHDPRVGGQRAQPGNPQRIRNVGGATRPGHTERGTDKRNDVRRGPAQAS